MALLSGERGPIVSIALVLSVTLIGLLAGSTQPGMAQAKDRSLIASVGECANPSVTETPNRAVNAMACMTNFARAVKGMPRYRTKEDLNRSARRKAADIVRCDVFSHTACNRPFTYWISRTYTDGRGCWAAGENIAWGTGPLGTVRSIFTAWMKSPGHRQAILSDDYRDLGIGLVTGRLNGRTANVWVQHFGRIC